MFFGHDETPVILISNVSAVEPQAVRGKDINPQKRKIDLLSIKYVQESLA